MYWSRLFLSKLGPLAAVSWLRDEPSDLISECKRLARPPGRPEISTLGGRESWRHLAPGERLGEASAPELKFQLELAINWPTEERRGGETRRDETSASKRPPRTGAFIYLAQISQTLAREADYQAPVLGININLPAAWYLLELSSELLAKTLSLSRASGL